MTQHPCRLQQPFIAVFHENSTAPSVRFPFTAGYEVIILTVNGTSMDALFMQLITNLMSAEKRFIIHYADTDSLAEIWSNKFFYDCTKMKEKLQVKLSTAKSCLKAFFEARIPFGATRGRNNSCWILKKITLIFSKTYAENTQKICQLPTFCIHIEK